MENSTNKQRTSKCREWEKQRRNRFNEAIIKLGEVVKEMLKNNPQFETTTDNVQYPKIEIIQKATLCLTTCAQEQTQLKAEVLALQVKLEAEKKPDKKDASIQVSAIVCKKNKNNKYVKLVMLQKSKKKSTKNKSSISIDSSTKNQTENNQNKHSKPDVKNNIPKMPKLLPLTNNNKKGMESTIVMLPSAPYISFPQRPLLLPSLPPAIVFVDPNIQTLNKPAPIPIINRSNGDMTKTTMVNILPISAYSGPLSASNKPKKNNVKPKQQSQRKVVKKSLKQVTEKPKIPTPMKDVKTSMVKENKNQGTENLSEKEKLEVVKTSSSDNNSNENDVNILSDTKSRELSKKEISSNKEQETKTVSIINTQKISEPNSSNSIEPMTNVTQKPNENIELRENGNENGSKPSKICSTKDLLIEDKDKENKLPHLLETTLCDNVVDGGNARLELAEEFLAASPTAAFLMSFPLVSGNRADSPAEEHHIHTNLKENSQKVRNDIQPPQPLFFPKPNEVKAKVAKNSQSIPNVIQKQMEQPKFISNAHKELEPKVSNAVNNSSSDNPFLNLSMPSLITTSCALTDSTFSLEFDCNISKANQSASVVSSNNLFYKNDPLNAAKSTIYSTSNISSGHEFNSIGLYPCAMEKFSGKNKTDFSNMEDNLMKIGPSRLTYDIDLGWSHKGFDFVTCTTTTTTFNKDNILTTAPMQYSSSYNPFNPEFHVPLVANGNKKDNVSTKQTTSFPEAITSFYSQPTNLWSDDMTFYSSNNFSKNFTTKPQNFVPMDHAQTNMNLKAGVVKQYEAKIIPDPGTNHAVKPAPEGPSIVTDKYTKKSPSKMHINWMTSEIRPMQNNCNPGQVNVKDNHKPLYPQSNITLKKQDVPEGNYFPINMHNFPSHIPQEEFHVWPTARAAGTTEISIEPPPINLPTLVGDLALGPHDKKKNDAINRVLPQADLQNCNNFFSVTQLMNRSSDGIPSRYQSSNIDTQKSNNTKHNIVNANNTDQNRKVTRLETQLSQPCYVFNDTKPLHYETMGHFGQSKQKNNKPDKIVKNTKTSYSAEALIRGGPCNQKTQDTTITKFMLPPQKLNDFNVTQDSGVAQVSHFPPLLEYPDNSYTGQQFSGTNLYNSTTNTISNSFYSNFIPASSNLMTGNYPSGPFQSEFMDYNQPSECNYTNYKYEELKMKVNTATLHDKTIPSQHKGVRRETSTKHKLECHKKETSKKCNNKRAKLSNDVEEWNDSAHLLWQTKTPTKRHNNISEDIPFHNYVSNQLSAGSQYQPEIFNTHLMPSNMQNVTHNIDRSLSTFPPTSRANFNLSTIFPEITMKVQ
ncbi:putative mediator of RNA polymerase II transcription subunit 26 [Battus philenor]|uniref:putative mediator of RNA polymerase II transcription subunit 26 n=1 Tax=Battus philenor TaxID=42288 RepID=UPI0035D09BC8